MVLADMNWPRVAKLVTAGILNLTAVVGGAQTVAPDRGFVLAPIPTTADPPGTVFRVDATGVRFDVADLSAKLSRHIADVALPDFTSSRNVEAGFLVRFFTPKAVGAAAASTGKVLFRVRGAKKESTTDAEIDRALQKAAIAFHPGRGKYYIIRESISATAVDYELSNELLAALSGGAQIAAALRGNASIKVAAGDGRKLQQTFKTPHRIFYKIEQLLPPPTGPYTTARNARAPVSSKVVWNSQRAEPGSALALAAVGLSRIQFLALQQELRDQGCGVSRVDGRYGPETRRAIATCARKFNTTNSAAALVTEMNVGFGPEDNPSP